MHLILLRHAEAEDDVPDMARRLTPAGRRQAQRIGAWLDAHLPPSTRIVVSPAQRALETAKMIGREFETDSAVGPGRDVDALLASVEWPGAKHAVLVVGHQPTLGESAARLVGGPDGGYRLAPAAVWWLVRRAQGPTADVRLVLSPDLL